MTSRALLSHCIESTKGPEKEPIRSIYAVNVDCVKFEYVVLAKYQHMLIFEFDLLTKQQILILCKKLLSYPQSKNVLLLYNQLLLKVVSEGGVYCQGAMSLVYCS